MTTRKPALSVDLRMRVAIGDAMPIGPGKVALLEAIARTGSIAAAARDHAMSYSRAWKLVAEVNAAFDEPLVVRATGGTSGGGALLTARAAAFVKRYRAIEAAARGKAERDLDAWLNPPRRPRP